MHRKGETVVERYSRRMRELDALQAKEKPKSEIESRGSRQAWHRDYTHWYDGQAEW